MKFATIRERKDGKCQFRGQTGGRGLFFPFWYELQHDPTAEWLIVEPGPKLRQCLPRAYWPDIEAAVRETCEANCMRLCLTRFTIPFAHYHDVDTTSIAVRNRVSLFMRHAVLKWAQEIECPAAWLTTTVAALARGIHADSAFDRLPILSDALQDAGCIDPLVIDHLQMCPDHGTSCWVVEMILSQLKTK
jgi:hypothetical protein